MAERLVCVWALSLSKREGGVRWRARSGVATGHVLFVRWNRPKRSKSGHLKRTRVPEKEMHISILWSIFRRGATLYRGSRRVAGRHADSSASVRKFFLGVSRVSQWRLSVRGSLSLSRERESTIYIESLLRGEQRRAVTATVGTIDTCSKSGTPGHVPSESTRRESRLFR